jgi:hypothetical protein
MESLESTNSQTLSECHPVAFDWLDLRIAIHNIQKMINSRKNSLWMMRRFLEDPVNCDQLYKYRTVYTRGPQIVVELYRLQQIKAALWKMLRTSQVVNCAKLVDNVSRLNLKFIT